MAAPKVCFMTRIYHPNVDKLGRMFRYHERQAAPGTADEESSAIHPDSVKCSPSRWSTNKRCSRAVEDQRSSSHRNGWSMSEAICHRWYLNPPIIKYASLPLFCQDFFLLCLHLMDTVLETLQNKSPDTVSPLLIKCTWADLCLVLIHCCKSALAEARSIVWIVVKCVKAVASFCFYSSSSSWFKYKAPGEGNGNPLQHSCLKSHGQRSLGGYSPWGRKSQIQRGEWTTTTVNEGSCQD